MGESKQLSFLCMVVWQLWMTWMKLCHLFYFYLFVYLTCIMHNKDIVPEIAISNFFIVTSFIGSIQLKWGFWSSMLLWWSLLPWPLISSKANHLCIWASCCQHFTSCGTSWRGWSHLVKCVHLLFTPCSKGSRNVLETSWKSLSWLQQQYSYQDSEHPGPQRRTS